MKKIVLALILVALMGMLTIPALAIEHGEYPDRLVLGMVPSREANKLVENLEPLAAYLSEAIGVDVYTYISTSYTGLIEAMGKGKVDIGLFGPFGMVLAEQRYGVKIVANTVRYGANQYRAQFNVRADSGIDSLEDIKGKTVAFVDPASASGYLFPYVFLKNELGIDPEKDINYIFAGGHDAGVLAVYNGDVDVALSFEDARTTIEDEHPDVMEKVKVIGYTNYIPNDGAVVRKELDNALIDKIVGALVEMGETEEEVKILDDIFDANGFAETSSENYEVVRDTYELMKDQITEL
ncbi:MAG: phosphate/phosphite/phosphonate ABC transporter substrate-binding protein [Halanaerobium sp.]|nr:phosphate/phosphite/phosphonate ABC transporter substrate-binding protein [Halanaerobium sp.]